jgi:hypothetical protein
MPDEETKPIQVLRCLYRSPCRVKRCTPQAAAILRGLDALQRPTIEHELCASHSEAVILREAQMGRNVVRLWTISSGKAD